MTSQTRSRTSRSSWSRPTVTASPTTTCSTRYGSRFHHVRQADDMVMFIGPDRAGTLIEVGVVIWWGGELAIAHAYRPARAKYLR